MTKLTTLREYSAMISGDAINEMKPRKIELLKTGELRFFQNYIIRTRRTWYGKSYIQRVDGPRTLCEKWVRIGDGVILHEYWRPVPSEVHFGDVK